MPGETAKKLLQIILEPASAQHTFAGPRPSFLENLHANSYQKTNGGSTLQDLSTAAT
jgi:hypothetical protein